MTMKMLCPTTEFTLGSRELPCYTQTDTVILVHLLPAYNKVFFFFFVLSYIFYMSYFFFTPIMQRTNCMK